MRRRSLLILSLSLLLIAGCGGGGSSSGPGGGGGGGGGTPPPTNPTTAKVIIDIEWGARSRAVQGPSSARSASITLTGAKPGGGDFTFVVNRNPLRTALHTETYTSAAEARIGTFPLTVRFFSQANGTGQVMGIAQASATVPASGILSSVITTVNTVRSVVIAAGQSVAVGQTANLVVTARNAAGAAVAVDASAIFVNVVSGQNLVRAFIPTTGSLPRVTGLRPGDAFVTATIDGVSSAAAVVKVTSSASVTITRRPAGDMIAGTSFDFDAVVANTPAGENGIAWSIAEGPAAGTIDANGVYTAPLVWTPQTTSKSVTIIATSVYDPSKTAQYAFNVLKNTVITVTPAGPLTIGVNETRTFTATVVGTASRAVTWQVEEPNGGVITANGVYTAPSVPGTYHILVTSVSDTTAVRRVIVNVQAGDGIIIIR